MKRALFSVLALLAFVLPAGADAHPLGNFTVNRYSGIELDGERVYVHYVLDLAEIPTLQEGDALRRPGFARRVADRLELRIDGRRIALRELQHDLSERPGAGNLPTARFEAVFAATEAVEAGGRAAELVLQDHNYGDRIGWREMVAVAEGGVELRSSDVPARSTSDALRAYPNALLRSPLDVSSAHVVFEPADGRGTPPELGTARSRDREGGFEALVSQEDLGAGVVVASLALAMFWGAAHALTPGHGKAIVAGYLVGSRGRPRHAVLLGLIVTVTHTIGVFALGLVTLLLSRFVLPERLYPWLTLVSGLLVVAVGASVLSRRIAHRRAHARNDEHRHDHPEHEHDFSQRGLLGVGVAAGLLPCPSALVVLLSALALHRVAFGLVLILAFSVGLAATISSIGLLAVLARRAFSRLRLDGPLVRLLPAASALLIVAVGVGITVNTLPEVF